MADTPTSDVNKECHLALDEFIPYRLANLAQHVSEQFATVYQQEYGLTIPEWRLLVHLADSSHQPASPTSSHEQAKTAKQLIDLTAMDKSTVSRAVKQMLEKGLLVKTTDSKDKRASLLQLTEEGLDLYQDIVPKALAWQEKLLSVLTDKERSALFGIFDKLDVGLKNK